MVSRYLGLLWYSSADHNSIKASFREERIRGAAISNYLGHTKGAVQQILAALRLHTFEVDGQTGYCGEFFVQLLMTAAMDFASYYQPHLGCSVDKFLEAFTGTPHSLENTHFSGSITAFTQFIRCNSVDPSILHIERTVRFCHAIATDHQCMGCDLIIPFERPDGSIGVLFVEVKKHDTEKFSDNVYRKLHLRMQHAKKWGLSAFGMLVNLSRGISGRMSMRLVMAYIYMRLVMPEDDIPTGKDSQRADRCFEIKFVASNSWECPTEMENVVQLAAMSTRVSAKALHPNFHPMLSNLAQLSEKIDYEGPVRRLLGSYLLVVLKGLDLADNPHLECPDGSPNELP